MHNPVLHLLAATCLTKTVFVTLNGTWGGRTNKVLGSKHKIKMRRKDLALLIYLQLIFK